MSTLTGIASILNAVQVGSESVAGLSNMADKALREKAQTDLMNMSVNLEADTNQFLNDLYQTNDYENWQQKTDSYLKAQNDKLQKSSKNAFTAKAADEMLKQSRNNIMQKVAAASISKIQEQQNVEDADTKQKLKNICSGQDLLNSQNAVDDMAASQGRLSPEQLVQNKTLNAINVHYTEQTQKSDQLINYAIAKGKSIDYVIAELEKSEPLHVFNNGKELTIDYSSVNSKIKSYVKNTYNARQQDLQDNNENKLSQFYANIFANPQMTNEDIYAACTQGRMMAANLGGNQLASGRQKFWVDAFNSIEKSATSKSGSNTQLDSFESYIKNFPDTFIEKVKDGTIDTLYDARDILQGVIQKEFNSKDWKETKNLSESEKDTLYQGNYSSYATINLLNNKQVKEIIKNDFPEVLSLWESFSKDYEKDLKKNPKDRKYTENAAGYISDMILDTIAGSSLKGDKTAISKNIKNYIASMTLEGLDSLFKKGGSEKALLQNTAAFEDNDLVFTDQNGQEVWAPEVKTKFDENAKNQKSYIESALGITLGEATTKKVNNDAEPIAQFRDKDGNEYYVKTTRNKKDKAKTLEVYKNGVAISEKELKASKKAQHDLYEQNKKESNTQKKELKVNSQNEKLEGKYYSKIKYEELDNRVKQQVSKEQWEELPSVTREWLINNSK